MDNSTHRPSRRTTASMLLGVALLLSLAGCGSGRSSRGTDPFAAAGSRGALGRISIEVQNLNFNDATVFAVRGGQPIRLGNVTGKTDKTFATEWDFALPVRFRVDLVGGGQCTVTEIPVDPGDHIWLQIPSDTGLSQCRISKR